MKEVILNSKYYDINLNLKDEEEIIRIMRMSVIDFEGEIYEMEIGECPEFYAGKANPKEFYKSLNVIKKI